MLARASFAERMSDQPSALSFAFALILCTLSVVSQGVLHAVSEDGKVLRVMTDGSFFGEFALLTNEPRSCSVVAQEHCDLFVLEKDLFEQAVCKYPSFEYHMHDIAKARLRPGPLPDRRASASQTEKEVQKDEKQENRNREDDRRASVRTGPRADDYQSELQDLTLHEAQARMKSWGTLTS